MTDRNDGEAVAYSGNFADRRALDGEDRRAADRGEDTDAPSDPANMADRRATGRRGRRFTDRQGSSPPPDPGDPGWSDTDS